MINFTKIGITAIISYTAYKIAADFNNTLIAISTITRGGTKEKN